MKIQIIMLDDDDEQTGCMFEISNLTSFVAGAVFDKLYDLSIKGKE